MNTASKPLHGVPTDDDLAALQRRNEERAALAREQMGKRFLLHPANRVAKQENCRIVLDKSRLLF